MAVRLFGLKHVPTDEADGIRQLLQEHGIDFYETAAGGWGISTPAIWLHDNQRLNEARKLIDSYQEQYYREARETYRQLKARGQHPTILRNIGQHPLQFVALLLLILFILYVSLAPFIDFLS